MSESLKYAITVRNVSFSYGNQIILSSVNISVTKGEIYGLLGPSGSGKTTILKLIIGLREPNNGHVSVFGYKPGTVESGTPGIGVGYMPQEISLPEFMTINEVFKYFGNIYLLDSEFIETKMKYFLKTFNLDNESALIYNLSGGEKRRVSLAIALFSSPRLLILDEPTVGVDPLLRQTIWWLLERLTRESNTTIIVTTHYIEEMRCASTVAFMRKGKILEEMEPNKAITTYNCLNLESLFLELCVKQRESNRNPTKNNEAINQSYISVVEPLKKERKRKFFNNETRAIKAIIMKLLYYYWRMGGIGGAYIIPLIVISICIFCFGKNPNNVPIGWIVDELPTNYSMTGEIDAIPYLPDLLLNTINEKVINVMKYNTVEEAIKDAKRMKIIGYIHLKQNFSENFYNRDLVIIDDSEYVTNDLIDSGTVHFYLDATNLLLRQLIEREMFETVLKFREEAFMKIGISGNRSALPFKITEAIHESIGTEDVSQVTHDMVVSLLVITCFNYAMTLAADSVVTMITSDVYSRSVSAGLKAHHLVIGELVAQFLFMSSSLAIILIASLYVFNVSINGSLLLAIINIQLAILCGVSLGALFAVFLRSIFFCYVFLTAVSLTIILISGAIWTVEAQPYFLKSFTPLIPGILPVSATLKIFNYNNIDFTTYIFPAFVSSISYCTLFSVATCYFLKRVTL